MHGSPQVAQSASSRKWTTQPSDRASSRFASTSSSHPLARQHGLDQLVEAGRDHHGLERGELAQPGPNLDVPHDPPRDLLERRRDRPELERDLLVQRQVDADARLELREQRRVAELVDHLHERVPDGDRPVPVDDEAQAARGAR